MGPPMRAQTEDGDPRAGLDRAMPPDPLISVVFFGVPRCSSVTVPSIEARMLEPLRRCGRVEVTYHLFLQDRIDNARSGESGSLDPSNYDFLAPYRGTLESPPDFHDSEVYGALWRRGCRWDGDAKSLHNSLLQLHSLASAWGRIRLDDPDVVVFLRPDLLYHDAIDPVVVQRLAHRPSACVLPGWQWYHGCNDRFAICGRRAAEVYATRGDRIGDWLRRTRTLFESEALLAYALRTGGVEVAAMPHRASRVRLGGRIHEERFTCRCLSSPGVRLELWRAKLRYALMRSFGD